MVQIMSDHQDLKWVGIFLRKLTPEKCETWKCIMPLALFKYLQTSWSLTT